MESKGVNGTSGRVVRRHWVQSAGVTLTYTVEGTGTPLLVVGSSRYYPRTFSRDLRQSCTLVCADLPHFVSLSQNFQTESISFDSYAEHINAIRVSAGLERVAVVRHSHHGNVALEYAKRYHLNVSHVVLIGTPPVNIAQTVKEAERYWACSASDERKAVLQQRRCMSDSKHLTSLPPTQTYISQYVTDAPLYWNDPNYDASWLWEDMTFDMDAVSAFRGLYSDYELSWDEDKFNAPVLVVLGRNDFAVPHTLWKGILPRLANVTFHLLEHSGHTPQLEQPKEFDQLLLGWLQ